MTPPEHEGQGIAEAPEAQPAVLSLAPVTEDLAAGTPSAAATPGAMRLDTLRQRADFLRAASARRQSAGSFLVQARDRGDDSAVTRVGFTASKKVGNAVLRNRAKRRLREIARDALPRLGRAGWDYVLVARPGATITRDFAALRADLEGALRVLHRERSAGERPAGGKSARDKAVEGKAVQGRAVQGETARDNSPQDQSAKAAPQADSAPAAPRE